LLDPNKLSKDGTVSLTESTPSEDGKLLVYGTSSAGSDWQEFRVRDIATGNDMADVLHWIKFSGASWARDGSGFYYSRYAEPKPGAAQPDGVVRFSFPRSAANPLTAIRCPLKRAKSLSRMSGRSTPGDDTSSVYRPPATTPSSR
jgi:protease II